MKMSKVSLADKFRGAVYGHAIGDAMGATTEFMNQEQIMQLYGVVDDIVGGGWLNIRAGRVTDDTEMSICVMDALRESTRKPFVFKRICASKFVEWYDKGPIDVGGSCAAGIRHYKMLGDYIGYNASALGNGALMRALPCALLGFDALNVQQASITHNNEMQSEVIESYSKVIRGLVRGSFKLRGFKQLQNPSGHVKNTFNNACHWASLSDFSSAIIGAVNHGGDADTIAAITGSLAGARFGFRNIPEEWVSKLDGDVVCKLEIFLEFAINYCITVKSNLY